jgi:hypothetical protein
MKAQIPQRVLPDIGTAPTSRFFKVHMTLPQQRPSIA